jgi:iron complex outermembrane receptor protein
MATLRKSALATSIFVALSASSLVGINQAVAQETADQEDDFEIISISRKRPESLQEVPIAVTAISEKMIDSAGIERPGDFIGLIPNVTMVDAANVGDTQVTIRGIVSTRDAEGTFAYVVDGVLMTNPNSFNEELLDVSQIEVLKGPQGALYGRNAVSGAIIVTTKMPADELEGRVTLGVGNNNSQRINGVISGPLSENVRGRLTASYMKILLLVQMIRLIILKILISAVV